MMDIGWRMDGLLSSCCHCLIKFNIFTLNSVLIFAKLVLEKIEMFWNHSFWIFQSTLQLYLVYFFEWIVNMFEHFLELGLSTDTIQLCTFSCQDYQTLFLYLNFKINDVTRFKTCVFPSCVGQLVKVNKTGAVTKMVEWSELVKIIFSIILLPHK